MIEVYDFLSFGELHVIPAHELIQVNTEALVLEPAEDDGEQLKASSDVLGDLAHFRKMLDVDIYEVQELADLHALHNV